MAEFSNRLNTVHGVYTTSGNIQFGLGDKFHKVESGPANNLLYAENTEVPNFYKTFMRYMELKTKPIVSEEV